jgi:hypothetical protein
VTVLVNLLRWPLYSQSGAGRIAACHRHPAHRFFGGFHQCRVFNPDRRGACDPFASASRCPSALVRIGREYQFQKSVGSNLHTGFDNLEVGAKYQFLVNAEHETILSLGVDAEIGDTGCQAIAADSFSTGVPGFF